MKDPGYAFRKFQGAEIHGAVRRKNLQIIPEKMLELIWDFIPGMLACQKYTLDFRHRIPAGSLFPYEWTNYI